MPAALLLSAVLSEVFTRVASIMLALAGTGTWTVVAPRITYQVRRERGSAVPREVTVVEETALVNIGDLDLTRTSDLYTLEERITEAAARVCQGVAQQVPEGQPNTEVCTRRAIDDAMAQAQMIVRVANQR